MEYIIKIEIHARLENIDFVIKKADELRKTHSNIIISIRVEE